MAKEIIIDCDPGIDDALAILFALAALARIKAITTSAGNVGVGRTTRNLLNILSLTNCEAFPQIGKGAATPLCGRLRTARHVHGSDGLGNSGFPPKALGLKIEDATSVLARSIRAHPGITVVVTGPLTNIANLFLNEPRIARHIGRLVVMGGALRVAGNISKFAEFNIGADPEAAHIVLNSKAPLELVSLDVTHKVILREGGLESFKKTGTTLSKFVLKICRYAIDYHKKNRRAEGMYLHDPLAMGIALYPRLGAFEKLSLGVKLKGRERGRIFIKAGRANVKFCRDVQAKKFLNIFLTRLIWLTERKE